MVKHVTLLFPKSGITAHNVAIAKVFQDVCQIAIVDQMKRFYDFLPRHALGLLAQQFYNPLIGWRIVIQRTKHEVVFRFERRSLREKQFIHILNLAQSFLHHADIIGYAAKYHVTIQHLPIVPFNFLKFKQLFCF